MTLTEREWQTLEAVARTGGTHAEVATQLGISEQTVKNHLSSVYRALGVSTQTQAFVVLGWLKVGRRR